MSINFLQLTKILFSLFFCDINPFAKPGAKSKLIFLFVLPNAQSLIFTIENIFGIFFFH